MKRQIKKKSITKERLQNLINKIDYLKMQKSGLPSKIHEVMINAQTIGLDELYGVLEDLKERELNDIKILSKQKKIINKLLRDLTSGSESAP